MQKRVDAALEQLFSKARPTIAFHARGGDKRDEDVKCAQAACYHDLCPPIVLVDPRS